MKKFFIRHWKKALAIVLVLAFLLCSVTVLAKTFTDPETYKGTIQSIDEKKVTVLGVSAAIAGSATLLAAVKDDTTTPVAEKLMDLTTYLLAVVCVLVLEKSLLTVFGAVACYLLIPIACVLAMVFVINRKKSLIAWATKIIVLALAFLLIVPSAMKMSDYIYEVNQVKIEEEAQTIVEPEQSDEKEEKVPWYKKLWNEAEKAVKETAEKALEKGKQMLYEFTDEVALFVIAYCVIPIFVVFLFLWLFKILFNINLEKGVEKLNFKKHSDKVAE